MVWSFYSIASFSVKTRAGNQETKPLSSSTSIRFIGKSQEQKKKKRRKISDGKILMSSFYSVAVVTSIFFFKSIFSNICGGIWLNSKALATDRLSLYQYVAKSTDNIYFCRCTPFCVRSNVQLTLPASFAEFLISSFSSSSSCNSLKSNGSIYSNKYRNSHCRTIYYPIRIKISITPHLGSRITLNVQTLSASAYLHTHTRKITYTALSHVDLVISFAFVGSAIGQAPSRRCSSQQQANAIPAI